MALHEVAFTLEPCESFGPIHKFARVGQVLLNELLHLLLDLLEIFGSKRGRTIEVVEESILGCGTMAELGLGEKFEHGGSQQMRGRMPVDFERLRVAVGQDAEVGIFFERTGEVDQIAIRFSGESGVGQTRADGLGDIERSGAFRDFFGAPVGELEMNAVRHG